MPAARARVVRGLFSSLVLFDAAESFQVPQDSVAGDGHSLLKGLLRICLSNGSPLDSLWGRKGSGDLPGLQSRRFGPSRVEWWIRLPHAPAKPFVIKRISLKLTPNQALTPIQVVIALRFGWKDAQMHHVRPCLRREHNVSA